MTERCCAEGCRAAPMEKYHVDGAFILLCYQHYDEFVRKVGPPLAYN